MEPTPVSRTLFSPRPARRAHARPGATRGRPGAAITARIPLSPYLFSLSFSFSIFLFFSSFFPPSFSLPLPRAPRADPSLPARRPARLAPARHHACPAPAQAARRHLACPGRAHRLRPARARSRTRHSARRAGPRHLSPLPAALLRTLACPANARERAQPAACCPPCSRVRAHGTPRRDAATRSDCR